MKSATLLPPSHKSAWGNTPASSWQPSFSPTVGGWSWAFRGRNSSSSLSGIDGTDGSRSHPYRRTRKLARLEAVLLVADGALSFRKLAQFATLADAAEARHLVQELNAIFDRSGAAFRIETLASGVRMMTRPGFALWLDRLHNRQARAKLSSPMLETLSIVAYRQPVTRADVEKIRGVQSSEMLKQLMERGLVKIVGEDDSLGRPYLYGTTKQFLEEYGFGSLDDLPMSESLRRKDDLPEESDSDDVMTEVAFAETPTDDESSGQLNGDSEAPNGARWDDVDSVEDELTESPEILSDDEELAEDAA